jgi:hypothetical protein
MSRPALLSLALVLTTACGDGDDDDDDEGPSDCGTPAMPLAEPNLDPAKLLNSLTPQENAALCDWGVSQFGGYCANPRCPSGTPITVADSREQCIEDTPRAASCEATVGDQVACVEAVAMRPCTDTFFLESACEAVLECALVPM